MAVNTSCIYFHCHCLDGIFYFRVECRQITVHNKRNKSVVDWRTVYSIFHNIFPNFDMS